MTKIHIETDDGIETVAFTGNSKDAEKAIKSFGYDPDAVEWSVEKTTQERMTELEQAVGRDGQGQRGIAERIDELEDRVAELEESQ